MSVRPIGISAVRIDDQSEFPVALVDELLVQPDAAP